MARTALPDARPADPRRRWILPTLLPAAIAVLWLATDAAGILPAGMHEAVAFVPIGSLVLAISLGLLVVSYRYARPHLRPAALLLPCAAAPLALLYPWTATPGLVPPGGFGAFPYFLDWLTRYPDFGPVNIAVLGGILAVLGAGFLPVLAAILVLMRASPRLLRLTVAAILATYLPVLVRLDITLSVVAVRLVETHAIVPYAIYGPALRAMAAAAALALAFAPDSRPDDVSPASSGSHPAHR